MVDVAEPWVAGSTRKGIAHRSGLPAYVSLMAIRRARTFGDLRFDQRGEGLRVLHVITDLTTGGAQRMLQKLVTVPASDGVVQDIVSLGRVGAIGGELSEVGIRIHQCGLSNRPTLKGLRTLVGVVRRWDPDVVQTWMYHADLIAGSIARILGHPRIFWNVRHGTLDWSAMRRTSALVVRATVPASRLVPHRIICCSAESARVHRALGYPESKLQVIENGFDLDRFRFSSADRLRVRSELDIPAEGPVVLALGRHHPQKDHETLVRAMKRVAERLPGLTVLCAGPGMTWVNPEVEELFRPLSDTVSVHLLGERSDVPALLSATDVLVSTSSHGEGFPNVLGEAMACRRPCVTTDVGDSARIVGETGRIADPGDDDEIAAQVCIVLECDDLRDTLGAAARARVERHFSREVIRQRYVAAWKGEDRGPSEGTPLSPPEAGLPAAR